MTTDAQGREHHPAGSPASIGGQYAQQTSPAAAAELDSPRVDMTEALEQVEQRFAVARSEVRLADIAARLRDGLSDAPWIEELHYDVARYAGDWEADNLRVTIRDDEDGSTQTVPLDSLGDGGVEDVIHTEITALGAAWEELGEDTGESFLDLTEKGVTERSAAAMAHLRSAHAQLGEWLAKQS